MLKQVGGWGLEERDPGTPTTWRPRFGVSKDEIPATRRPPATEAAQAAPGSDVFALCALHDEGQALVSTPDNDGAFKNRVPKGGTRIERWNGRPACGCETPQAPPWLPTFEPP